MRKRPPSTVCTYPTHSAKVVPVTFLMGTTVDTDGQSNNRKGRPNYPVEFKHRVATAACESGVSVSKLAQQHGINANMLFKWRRNLRAGLLTEATSRPPQFLPVVVQRSADRTARAGVTTSPTNFIEIVIADALVRVSASTDAALLQLVLHSLRK